MPQVRETPSRRQQVLRLLWVASSGGSFSGSDARSPEGRRGADGSGAASRSGYSSQGCAANCQTHTVCNSTSTTAASACRQAAHSGAST